LDVSLVTQKSLWWLLPIILVSLGLVYWQYFHKNKYHNNLSRLQVLMLSGLRFTAYFLILFLLLGPRVKYNKRVENKPILIFAQDNSSSIRFSKDSSYYLNQYPNEITTFFKDVEGKYKINKFTFGENVKNLDTFQFEDSQTDFSEFLTFLKDNYGANENIQVLLASDGLYNTGKNPAYEVNKLGIPIHTIQLGDTSAISDVSIYSVKSNKIAFTNNKMPVRVGIKANNITSGNFQIEIKRENKVLIQDEISSEKTSFYIEKDYFIQANKKGIQRFVVNVISDSEEYTLKNNSSEFVVEVLESKRKIAICFDQYHPDLAAIKSALDENKNFNTELIDVSEKNVDLKNVNLCVMYQIPSTENSYAALFQRVVQQKIPLLMIIGGSSGLAELNILELGVNFPQNSDLVQNAVYDGNKLFSLFQSDISKDNIFEKLPPLQAPFGMVNFNVENQVLANQKVKGISTNYPLISFSSIYDQKIAWIFGEGMWRWKLHEFQMYESNDSFNELLNKIVQYQALKVNKDQLILKHDKDFIKGDVIKIDAELYNKSYQVTNKPDLNIVLTDSKGKSYNYNFNKDNLAFSLSLNFLEKDKYTYQVKTVGLEKELQANGAFVVRDNDLESKSLEANGKILKQISKSSNGEYFALSNLKKLKKFLLSEKRTKPTVTVEVSYGYAVDLLYLLSFIVIIMILEWFLRKYWLGN